MKPGENYYLMSYNDKTYKRTSYEFIKHIGWEVYNGNNWCDCNFVEDEELEKQYKRIKKLERICK